MTHPCKKRRAIIRPFSEIKNATSDFNNLIKFLTGFNTNLIFSTKVRAEKEMVVDQKKLSYFWTLLFGMKPP